MYIICCCYESGEIIGYWTGGHWHYKWNEEGKGKQYLTANEVAEAMVQAKALLAPTYDGRQLLASSFDLTGEVIERKNW